MSKHIVQYVLHRSKLGNILHVSILERELICILLLLIIIIIIIMSNIIIIISIIIIIHCSHYLYSHWLRAYS